MEGEISALSYDAQDDSMKDEEVAMLEEDDNSGHKLDINNGSASSLDQYVGKGRNSKYMTLLPENFEPGEMDVLCGRGKRCFNSPGNQRFRKLVAARADEYSAATTRTDKTFIVCSIVAEVRKASPKGGFVKKDSTTGRWYEVGDFNAHEKTSQMFRDVLHENYLSSNKSKKKRRDLFRINSKRHALMQQQQASKTINASAGRFIRGGVARHHSYGSVKRAVGAQQYNLLNMRTASQSSAHSVHSGHESWQNSWQSGDGIKSEPGMLLSNNPRLAFATRRQNSFSDMQGSMGDMNSSYGELQQRDQFHNSFGEFNTGADWNAGQGANNAAFHNSCVEFPSSFAEKNNLVSPQDFHNSFGEFNTNTTSFLRGNNGDFDIDQNDLHNSFGELPLRNRANGLHPGFRHSRTYSPNPELEPEYSLEVESVPLSIAVPQGAPSGIEVPDEQFQLEFETEENSGSYNRSRGRIPVTVSSNQPLRMMAAAPREMGDISLMEALEGAYEHQNSGATDDNPFEPVPLPDVEPESLYRL